MAKPDKKPFKKPVKWPVAKPDDNASTDGFRFELAITGDIGTPTPSMCWLIKDGVVYYASTLSSGLAVFDSALGGSGWNGADMTWNDMPEGTYTIDLRSDGYSVFNSGTYEFTKSGGLVPSSVQMEKLV